MKKPSGNKQLGHDGSPRRGLALVAGEMTRQQFATHLGVSLTAVHIAQKRGLFNGVIREVQRCSRTSYVITDVPKAVELWMSRSKAQAPALGLKYGMKDPNNPEDNDGVPDENPFASTYAARRQLEAYKAKLAKMEFDMRAGKLVDARMVEDLYARQVTEAKTKLMAVAKHARARIPHLSVDDVEVIEDLVREALEDLAANALEVTADVDAG